MTGTPTAAQTSGNISPPATKNPTQSSATPMGMARPMRCGKKARQREGVSAEPRQLTPVSCAVQGLTWGHECDRGHRHMRIAVWRKFGGLALPGLLSLLWIVGLAAAQSPPE